MDEEYILWVDLFGLVNRHFHREGELATLTDSIRMCNNISTRLMDYLPYDC